MADSESSPHQNEPTVDDPRVEMLKLWHRAVGLDRRLHSFFIRKYPRLLRWTEWVLALLYLLLANPITALVVSLLLVSLVISGSIRVIVWLSVMVAWLFSVLGFTRIAGLKQLSVIVRTFLVGFIAVVLCWISMFYIQWTLSNYYAHQEHHTANTPLTSGTDVDSDSLWNRLQALLENEVQRATKSKQVRRSDFEALSVKAEPSTEAAPKNPYDSLSRGELRVVAKLMGGQIQDLILEWNARAKEINLRYDTLTYDKSPRPTGEEWQKAEDGRAQALKVLDSTYQTNLKDLVNHANEIRTASRKWLNLPADKDTDELFKTYAAGTATSLGDDRPFEISQYLLEMSKKL